MVFNLAVHNYYCIFKLLLWVSKFIIIKIITAIIKIITATHHLQIQCSSSILCSSIVGSIPFIHIVFFESVLTLLVLITAQIRLVVSNW